jgi:hypothetical protein
LSRSKKHFARLQDPLDDDAQRHASWMEILNVQQQIDPALRPTPVGA